MIEIEARAWFEMSNPEVHAWNYMDASRTELRSQIAALLEQLKQKSVPVPTKDEFWATCRMENVVTALAIDETNPLDEKVVGMTMIFIHRKFASSVGYIEDVVVDENYQRQGIASRLIEKLLQVARHFKIPKIELTSNPNNPRRAGAIAMYLKMGFKLIAQSVDGTGTNLYRLVLAP